MLLNLKSILATGIIMLGFLYYIVFLQKKKKGTEKEFRYKVIFTVLFYLLMIPILFSLLGYWE